MVPKNSPAAAMMDGASNDAVANALVSAALDLSKSLAKLKFAAPVAHVYDPLDYAWAPHEIYLRRFAGAPRDVMFLGMNPGPFGMMQIGVPFGEVAAVRDWMGIDGPVKQPADMHPKRPIEGFGCTRSEVSGRRLWGWAAERWGSAERFFEQCFVVNYCPLGFLEASGRNFTPDKLPAAERARLYAACDTHLVACLDTLRPRHAIGIGGFAKARIESVLPRLGAYRESMQVGTILHPSPASPAANRGWAEQVDVQMRAMGVVVPGAGDQDTA